MKPFGYPQRAVDVLAHGAVVAGADYRDELYSWPSINPCRIDETLVAGGWTADGWFQNSNKRSISGDKWRYPVLKR